ncbi:MAG: peptidylprolyl isomerase [Verrucomicrobiaceae bacterium]|nr:peptidylprolyl isomerase [Verrucomicrobiaceae bacterium]
MITLLIPAAAALAVASLLCVPSAATAQTYSNGIAAVVNGKPIMKSEVRDAVMAQEQMLRIQFREDPEGFAKAAAELKATALDSLVDRELILSEFSKLGGTIKPQYVDDDINSIIRESFKGNRDAFVTELAKTGMGMKKFRELREKMIVVQVMRGRHSTGIPPATPREVEEFYQKNIDKFRDKDSIKISTITIPKFTGDVDASVEKQKKIAQEVRSKVVAGGDFATVAKTYSQDSRAEGGGAWDWMERKAMKKSMADAAFALKNGGISPVLDEESSFVIISCDAKKLGDAVPLDKVRPDIERVIDQQKAKESLERWLDDLRRKAVIKKMDTGIVEQPSAPKAAAKN